MLDLFRQRFRYGRATNGYPDVVEETPLYFRGMPRVVAECCDAAGECARVCPAGSIEVASRPDGGWAWTLDRASCLACGLCVEACPNGALEVERAFELAQRSREALKVTTVVQSAGGPAHTMETLGSALRDRVHALFGRSLQLRHLDVGSCNGCDWELNALLNPVYDLQRFGIDIVASPRHADGLLVTGPVTHNLEPALWATYDATPDPKLVIAIGACACDAGFLADSYCIAGGVDRRIPVDVYVPGCPPRPEAILQGLLLAMGRRLYQ
jgi:Ni,Fe-hydrogenase III small subunit/formate hydrogenlyase subunit 6/NADH:ubiquinone oxidoreductase subunit I